MWRNAGWFNAAVIGVALLAAGCSRSSVQLLKDGDAHVCTKSDVTAQLFEIIKQNAGTPDYSNLFPDDSADRVKGWINKVSFSVDGVTSKDVDAPNEKITCNGTVHIRASGVDKEQTSSVDYQVVADLSANKPVVTVNIGTAGYALGQVVQALAAPEVKEAQDKRAATNLAKDEAYEAAWSQSHQSQVNAIQDGFLKSPNRDHFTRKELDLLIHDEKLKAQCQGAPVGSDENSKICYHEQEIRKRAHDSNLCNPEYSTWDHCGGGGQIGPAAPGSTHAGPFTPEENAVVSQAQDLTDRCRDAEGATNPQVCDQSQAIVGKLKTMNICYGPEDAIEADKHWVRCSGG